MVVIKLTEDNILVLTNISYGKSDVKSVVNINKPFIVLTTDKGIDIYNKKYKKK